MVKRIAGEIAGYTYGSAEVAPSAMSLKELENLKVSAGFTAADEAYLRLAGTVLEGQTRQIVEHWRSGIIAGIPNLARHSRTPEGDPIPSIWRRATFAFSSGYWTPAYGPTI